MKWIKNKKVLSGILCFSLLVGSSQTNFDFISDSKYVAAASEYGLSNPSWNGEISTWDTIYFGNYWQSDNNGDGLADRSDAKEPLLWRVLDVKDNNAIILADKGVDCQPFNVENTSVTWESCSLRNWLNTSFFNDAFNEEEKSSVQVSSVVNKTGNNTEDKVYILSSGEAYNDSFGFNSKYPYYSETRVTQPTDYAIENGAHRQGWWWVRSFDNSRPLAIHSDDEYLHWGYPNSSIEIIRPVLKIDLNKSGVWKYAGSISSDGTTSQFSDEITCFAMSELVYTDLQETDGMTIEEKGLKDTYIDKIANRESGKNPDKVIPHKESYMTYKEYAEAIVNILSDWKIDAKYEGNSSGFYAVVFAKDRQRIFAIRGSQAMFDTEGNKDWLDDILHSGYNLMTNQMQFAIKKIDEDQQKNPDAEYIVTGHSLGGGLAMLVSNYSGIRGVAFDGSPTTDASYYSAPREMAKNFYGIDKWVSEDYMNENCPIGAIDKSIKNYITFRDRHSNIINPVAAHFRWSIIDYRNNVLDFSPIVDKHNFSVNDTIIKGINNVILPKGTLFLGNSTDEKISASLKNVLPHKDVIYGGKGNDCISGFNGADYLIGGSGDDILDGGSGNDTYVYWKGHGVDTIIDISGNDKLYIEGLADRDQITLDSDVDYVKISCNGDLIIKIKKKRGMAGMTNSFTVYAKDESYKLQDWNKWKNLKSITVACPTKVEIYDAHGTLVQTLQEELAEPIYTDYGYFYVTNEEGEKIKHLMLENDYSIKIIATDNGTMSFTSIEDTGDKIVINEAEDIQLKDGDKFDVVIGEKVLLEQDGDILPMQSSSYIQIDEIEADSKEIELNVADNYQITAKITPTNSTESIKYESSDDNIVTVSSQGLVSAVGSGEAYVSIYTDSGAIDVVKVLVSEKADVTVPTASPSSIPTVVPTSTPRPSSSSSYDYYDDDYSSSTSLKKPSKVTGVSVKNKKGKKIQVKWKWKLNVSGFQIQYALNSKFSKQSKKKQVGKYTSSKIIKGLKKGKTYYVRVRAYNKKSGRVKYGKWSKVKKVKIRK